MKEIGLILIETRLKTNLAEVLIVLSPETLYYFHMRRFFTLILILSLASAAKSQIVINEYSCSNYNSYADAFGNFSDWIELYNNGPVAIDLAGYYLSDEPSNPTRWQVPTGFNTVIAPGGRKMVFASDADTVTPSGQIHTNFKLTQSHGNWILLSDPSAVLLDSLQCRLTQRGHSRGRKTDAANTWGIFTVPTPDISNGTQTAYTAYATKPIFNLNAGNYTSTQNITLSSPDPNVTIYYTSNGTVPTATSTAYTTPIPVTVTVALRARAISSNPLILPSFTETNTYFINDAVDSRYNVVSLCGAFTAASSSGGGYLFGFGSTPAWSSLEYFDNNFTQQFEQEVLTSRHGNDSWAYAQKGMDVEAFDETGTKAEFAHAFFNTTLRDTFGRFILKNAGSDNFPLGPGNACHLRDVFAQTLAEKYSLDMDYRRFRPSIVFINGEYWGVYDFRERVDGEHFKYYYNKSKKKVDHLSYWGGLTIRLGSDTGWVNLYNYIMTNPMSVSANYNHVKDYLNIRSFSQYFIFNEYLVNHDWLNWNTMWWRARGNNPVKWRYVLWDEDAICGLNNPNYTGVGTIGPTNDPCEPTSLFQNNPSIKHTDMLTKLFNNPEFEQKFKAEWVDMLNGCFECQNILNHFDSLIAVFSPEMNRQAIRWGGSLANWNTNVTDMRNWIVSRCAVIGGALADTGCLHLNTQVLKLNVSPPNSGVVSLNGSVKTPYVWTSQLLLADTNYILKATPTAGPYWSFDHWENQDATNTINPSVTTDSIIFSLKKKDSVIAFFKYFNYDSIDITFDVNPAGTGNIIFNGILLSSYPSTFTMDRRNIYSIEALPNAGYKFSTWQNNNASTSITPSLSNRIANLSYKEKETVVANFEFVPPPPPLPGLTGIDKNQFFIPNVFSPNGDGKNDRFNVRINKDVTGLDMSIFNRWGQEIYHTSDINQGWDGTYGGQASEVGVYQYIIKLKFRDGTVKTVTGDLTLLR